MLRRIRYSALAFIAIAWSCSWMSATGHLAETFAQGKSDPLQAWNDGPAKKTIVEFVATVTKEGGKPIGINKFIGRRPIMAFGNSDGDFEMLEWTSAGKGSRFGLIVHHTDAEREYAYDRKSPLARLDKGLDEAPKRGWTVVSMKTDWRRVFAFEK
jgi:hypothetical protein